MGHRRKREPGPQQHAEGQHGEKTHKALIEQLQHSAPAPDQSEEQPLEGHHRLHEDRQQHDEAEKNSEKVEAMRDVQRGHIDENVLSHARIPHEGDSN
jgi:pyruvate/2-oxoglutarate dehydrogenase complex dihydrolipoamide acyltransferase (E2) component